MTCRRFYFIAIFILVIMGCSEDKDPLTLTPPPRNVEITVTVLPSYIKYGETAEIAFTVTNHGPDPVELEFRCKDHLGYRLEAENGTFTFSSPGLCEIGPHKLIMAPGWTQTLRERTPVNLPVLPYIVKAGILEHEDEYPWATTKLYVHW
jgi:hypothetical protein